MIAVRKLMSLAPGHRMRKAAQSLERAESALRVQSLALDDLRPAVLLPWLAELGLAFSCDSSLTTELRGLSGAMQAAVLSVGLQEDAEPLVRAVNKLRRSLEATGGVAPADWDFEQPLGLVSGPRERRVFPGVRVFLEDVRSPFNVGSMFRSADAFGVAEILVSGFTADIAHPRALRSAMGAIATVPWRAASLAELGAYGEIIALELRGESIDDFEFPERGVALIGSEELGVSPEALAMCSRKVSIPMLGTKGSLNVGVAFGILMNAWRRSLEKRGVHPEIFGIR